MSTLLEKKTQRQLLSKLLAWYTKEGRHDMPWRKTKDPYKILVSEYMLQQTTVATVRPYFDRFVKKFPTLKSLAESDLNEVLALWSGLGYYARARNLRSAAQIIWSTNKGKFPQTIDDLVKLPGIGFYTAGAIRSLAFNQPAPVLDANIIRVLMRLLAIADDPKIKAVQVVLRKACMDLTALSVRSKKGPRDVVLALMDLGATLCAPRQPECLLCPLADFCQARAHGQQEEIPPAKEKLERPTERQLFAIIENKKKFLVGQRPKKGLFGGLWEFFCVEAPAGLNPVHALEDQILEFSGLSIRVEEAFPAFEHQLSHKVLINRPYLCHMKKGSRKRTPKKSKFYPKYRWVTLAQLNRMGISSITKKIVVKLHEND